jgi:hypothetical protein
MVGRMIAIVEDHPVSEESVHFYPTCYPTLMSMERGRGKIES